MFVSVYNEKKFNSVQYMNSAAKRLLIEIRDTYGSNGKLRESH